MPRTSQRADSSNVSVHADSHGTVVLKSPLILILPMLLLWCVGCTPVIETLATAQEVGDPKYGITYYVGGAGPVGHVGSWDVPRGLADAGYRGLVEVFPWQSITHAGDQMNLARNREKGAELAERIRRYRRKYAWQEINIIALSAGTGVATFAIEYLPESLKVNRVIYLGCSMSSRYDLTRALKRISGGLYVLYSPHDRILRDVVWYTGTVDRNSATEGVAGLEGFRPPNRRPDTESQYAKVFNVAYRDEFTLAGYGGGHTDSTRRDFVRDYLADVIMNNDRRLLGPDHRRTPWQRRDSEIDDDRPRSRAADNSVYPAPDSRRPSSRG